MRISIEHKTTYRYHGEITHLAQYLRLTPATNPSQRVIDWSVRANGQLSQWRDAYGNLCHTLVVERPTSEIVITARGRVDTDDVSGILPPDESGPPPEVFLRPTLLTRPGAALREFAESYRAQMESDSIAGLHDMMLGMRKVVAYDEDATHVQSTAAEAFERGAGVCQDHAHIYIACCRLLGVPARYVSGYLYDGEHDAAYTASHAWASACVQGLGWVALDVANEISATERHIGVAHGLDYLETAPIRGVRSGGDGDEEMDVAVRVGATAQ